MVGPDRSQCAEVLGNRSQHLFYSRSQIRCARHVIPLLEQFPIFAENEDVKTRCVGLRAQLRSCRPIKIHNREDVASRITRNFLCVVSCLKPLRFFVNTLPKQHGRDLAPNRTVFFDEVDNRNHPVRWIAETKIRSTVSDGPHLVRICGLCQDQNSDVAVSGGQCASIDIDKIECIDLSD